MQILESVLCQILEDCPAVPPETGGLLGGQNQIITCVIFDKAVSVTDKAEYIPNIAFLNQVLMEWSQRDICFLGIFHSHPYWETELSEPDKTCISNIMQYMPENQILWFPIIQPQQKKIYSYVAYRKGGQLFLERDAVICRKRFDNT